MIVKSVHACRFIHRPGIDTHIVRLKRGELLVGQFETD